MKTKYASWLKQSKHKKPKTYWIKQSKAKKLKENKTKPAKLKQTYGPVNFLAEIKR